MWQARATRDTLEASTYYIWKLRRFQTHYRGNITPPNRAGYGHLRRGSASHMLCAAGSLAAPPPAPPVLEPLLSPVSELPPRRDAIVAALTSADPRVAVSVWAPRTSPEARGTAFLRAYNEHFLHLLEASPVAMHETYCFTTPVADARKKREVESALEATLHIIEEMHRGRAQGASGITLHVSFTGRVQYVYATLVALFDECGALLEWVTGMTPLPTIFTPQVGLQIARIHQHAAADSPQGSDAHSSSSSSCPPSPDTSDGIGCHTFVLQRTHPPPPQEWINVPSHQLKRKPSNNMANFRCTNCGATSTPQRRYTDSTSLLLYIPTFIPQGRPRGRSHAVQSLRYQVGAEPEAVGLRIAVFVT